MKKIIIYLTIASLLNLVGCYYQQQISPEEYSFDENLSLNITTKDTIYYLSPEDYYYDKDTLFVTSSKFIYKNNYRLQVRDKIIDKIPTIDIENLQIEKTDVAGTALVIVGTVVFVIVFLAFVSDPGFFLGTK
ncbi:MAG: hypothetical protein IPM14_04515 [bacterium]|nr:hypothetical protein [bacterium]